MRHKHKWLNEIVWFDFLKKTKIIHKIASRNSTIGIPIKSLCISPSSTKVFYYNRTSHSWFIGKISYFLWKYFWFMRDFFSFFLSNSKIWYCFLYFVTTLVAAAFHAQIFFNCSNSWWWMSKWYLSFVPSLKWEIMKKYIPQNNLS